MARAGRWAIRFAGVGAVLYGAATSATASGPAAGYVVMPHPNACRCSNEEQSFCDRLWERMRPRVRDHYLTRQHTHYLHHPECPPWCMENAGYYQTCWRRFPEHTLGCRDCWPTSGPPLPAPAGPVPTMTAPQLSPPPAPIPQPAAPAAPDEYDPGPAPALEKPAPPAIETTQVEIRPTSWSDPAWKAGLRPASGER